MTRKVPSVKKRKSLPIVLRMSSILDKPVNETLDDWGSCRYNFREAVVSLNGLRLYLPRRISDLFVREIFDDIEIERVRKLFLWESSLSIIGFISPNDSMGILPARVFIYYSALMNKYGEKELLRGFRIHQEIEMDKQGQRLYLPEGLAFRAGIERKGTCFIEAKEFKTAWEKDFSGNGYPCWWIEIWSERRRLASERR